MLKRLLATTAIAAIATSAYAANPATTGNGSAAINPAAINYVSKVDSSDLLATRLIGQPVYGAPNGATIPTANGNANADGAMTPNADGAMTPNADNHIGDINNLIVAKDGSVDAVIIGVGGVLGMGQKDVAVQFDSLQWTADENGKPVAYLFTTKDQLKNAPSLDVSMLQQNANRQDPPAMGDQNAADNSVALNPPATGAPDTGVVATDPGNGTMTFDATKISANDLMDTTVYDADNQNAGNVGDVIVTEDGKIDAVVVDVGGFLGIGEKPVAIAFEDLNIREDKDGNLTAYTTFTKDQLDNATQYDKSVYQSQRDTMRLHTQG